MGTLAVDDTDGLLVDGQGQNQFSRLRASLHVLLQEGEMLEVIVLEHLLRELVQGKGHLLVLHVRQIVVLTQVCGLLRLDHLPHHVHGRIVLALILGALPCHSHLLQAAGCLAQFDVQPLGSLDLHRLGLETHHGEYQFTLAESYLVLTVDVRLHYRALVVHVIDMHRRQRLASSCIRHDSLDELSG